MTDQVAAPGGAVPNWRDRSRLIDFFKRVFAIIAGLAITEACRRLLPAQLTLFELPGPSFWMFLALFITIIPIFHGGDRSLDVRHLDQRVRNRWERLKFVWDVYALLATGLLLVCAADAIPDVATIAKHDEKWTFAAAAADFYRWLGVFFIFNVLVLIVDRLTTQVPERLAPYKLWIPINIVMALACWGATHALAEHGDACLVWLPLAFCLLAVVRTLLDYGFSDADFMFP
jgi:hypothetical protein